MYAMAMQLRGLHVHISKHDWVTCLVAQVARIYTNSMLAHLKRGTVQHRQSIFNAEMAYRKLMNSSRWRRCRRMQARPRVLQKLGLETSQAAGKYPSAWDIGKAGAWQPGHKVRATGRTARKR